LTNRADHNVIFPPYVGSEDSETMDFVFRGTKEEVERQRIFISTSYFLLMLFTAIAQQWLKEGSGLMAQKCVLL